MTVPSLDEIGQFIDRMRRFNDEHGIVIITRKEKQQWLSNLGLTDAQAKQAFKNDINSEDFLKLDGNHKCEQRCDCLGNIDYDRIKSCNEKSECQQNCSCIYHGTLNRCIWEFGIEFEGKNIYVKFHELSLPDRHSIQCLSFHAPEHRMKFRYK
jgi:hypothetical protein